MACAPQQSHPQFQAAARRRLAPAVRPTAAALPARSQNLTCAPPLPHPPTHPTAQPPPPACPQLSLVLEDREGLLERLAGFLPRAEFGALAAAMHEVALESLGLALGGGAEGLGGSGEAGETEGGADAVGGCGEALAAAMREASLDGTRALLGASGGTKGLVAGGGDKPGAC